MAGGPVSSAYPLSFCAMAEEPVVSVKLSSRDRANSISE
jgi:hypothetical protein